MSRLEDLYQSMNLVLECPVCLDLPNSNVFQCLNGHTICSVCKAKLERCPMCKAVFLTTRNYVAENLVTLVKDMKVSVQCELNRQQEKYLEDLNEYKKKMSEKELKTEGSQTSCSMIRKLVSSSTQTVNRAQINPIKSTPDDLTVFYPCLIGPCPRKLPYRGLIDHLTQCHKDTYTEVRGRSNVFHEKFTIMCNVLPKYYDFAFLVHGMGLFFLKTSIDYVGGLRACVKIASDDDSKGMFEYAIFFKSEHKTIRRTGLVQTCLSRNGSCASVKADQVLPRIGQMVAFALRISRVNNM